MKNSAHTSLICIVTAVMISGMTMDTMAAKKKVKGKELFKTNCKICHDKGSENGEYTPMTLIGAQWERFFEKKYVKKHEDMKMPSTEGEQKTVTEAISAEDLEAIKEFSIKHAADSEHPMTCG